MTSKTGLGINEPLHDRRSQILAIAARHGAYNVRVFGSVARGEATEESDIDFWWITIWSKSRPGF